LVVGPIDFGHAAAAGQRQPVNSRVSSSACSIGGLIGRLM
jgi:hypothetical protein